MNVLVNGIGNIGTTLINVLCKYRSVLGIKRVYALKNTQVHNWNKAELEFLKKMGVLVCSNKTYNGIIDFDTIKSEINYVFDTCANGMGIENKLWYEELSGLKACCAQGSEYGFGAPYMCGINDEKIINKKYVQIVSCNTHALASIVKLLSKGDYNSINDIDFVIARRSEDLGNNQRLVGANVVSRHRYEDFGTHHAYDLNQLFKTTDVALNVYSSDVTTPSQLMHTLRFRAELDKTFTSVDLETEISGSQLLSQTSKFDSNVIFELGRKYGFCGRIFSHSIINTSNVVVKKQQNKIYGWAFVPQEGNTILSTIKAYMIQTNIHAFEDVFNLIVKDLIVKEL